MESEVQQTRSSHPVPWHYRPTCVMRATLSAHLKLTLPWHFTEQDERKRGATAAPRLARTEHKAVLSANKGQQRHIRPAISATLAVGRGAPRQVPGHTRRVAQGHLACASSSTHVYISKHLGDEIIFLKVPQSARPNFKLNCFKKYSPGSSPISP
jgi:hypothetical protein